MRPILSVCLWLAGSVVWAQSITLPAEVRVAPGEPTIVRAEAKGAVEWLALDRGLNLLAPGQLREANAVCVASAAAGRYRLLAVMGLDARVCVVVVGGSPDPFPPPPPPPPVPPVAGPLWILVVEETATPWPNRGAFAANTDLQARIKAKGHHWRVADQDVKDAKGQLPADLKPWLDRAKRQGMTLPALFLVSEKGQIVHEGQLPATPADLVKLLEAKGG